MCYLDYNTVISESLKMAFGLERYLYIIYHVQSVDFKDTNIDIDSEFCKVYKGYYKVRRSKEWCEKYFKYMQEQLTKERSFEELLKKMYKECGMIEVSFVSKLMATVNPQLPIWDKYVLDNLGLAEEWDKLNNITDRETKQKEKLKKAPEIYSAIISKYRLFLESENGKLCVAKFDEVLPEYTDELTDVKKIDFLLWSKRSDKIGVVNTTDRRRYDNSK